MLWTAIWAAYLGVLRLLLIYLGALGVPSPRSVGVSLTVYFVVLLPIRIQWGFARGLWIALLGTVLFLGCFAEASIIVNHFTGRSSETILESQWALYPCFSLGRFFGTFGFVFVHTLVVAVEWIDSSLQRKPPQDR